MQNMIKYRFLVLPLIVCALYNPFDFKDRFIAGQLAKHKHSQYYIERVPLYKKAFSQYQKDCEWGYYFQIEKQDRVPVFGVIITF